MTTTLASDHVATPQWTSGERRETGEREVDGILRIRSRPSSSSRPAIIIVGSFTFFAHIDSPAFLLSSCHLQQSTPSHVRPSRRTAKPPGCRRLQNLRRRPQRPLSGDDLHHQQWRSNAPSLRDPACWQQWPSPTPRFPPDRSHLPLRP